MTDNILDSAADRQIVYDGLDISLEPAPFWKRTLAYVVDLAVVTTILYAVFIFVFFISAIGAGLHNTALIIGVWVLFLLSAMAFDTYYFIRYETRYGATIGKRIFGLKVISLDGSQLSIKQCLIRAGMRYLECLTFFPCIISIIANKKKQRLGDLMAGTMVVYSATREKEKDFLYMDQDRYYMLEDAWKPKELEQTKADDLVAFAFHAILMASDPEKYDTEKKRWAKILKRYVSEVNETDDEDLLRFFAQKALISDNSETRRQ